MLYVLDLQIIFMQIVASDEIRITENMQNPNEFAGDNVICFFIDILLQFLVSDGSMIAGLMQQKNCRLTDDGIFCSLMVQYYNSQWTVIGHMLNPAEYSDSIINIIFCRWFNVIRYMQTD